MGSSAQTAGALAIFTGRGLSPLDIIAFFSDDRNMTYPGGKNAPGVYQTIINLMPPHAVYIEPFLGSGAILRLKRPARINIGIDTDPQVIEQWQALTATDDDSSGGTAEHGDIAGNLSDSFGSLR